MTGRLRAPVAIGVTALVVGVAFYLRAQRAADGREAPDSPDAAPATDIPTFIELGSDRCTSCRAMTPVLRELSASHAGRLNVRFIDVWRRPEQAERYGVTTIPTQVLLGPDGRELARHTGFWSATAIRGAFAAAGHRLAPAVGAARP